MTILVDADSVLMPISGKKAGQIDLDCVNAMQKRLQAGDVIMLLTRRIGQGETILRKSLAEFGITEITIKHCPADELWTERGKPLDNVLSAEKK